MKKLFYLFFFGLVTVSQLQAQDQINWILTGFYAQKSNIPLYRNCANRFTSTFQKVETKGNKITEKTIEIANVKYEAENGIITQINGQEFIIFPTKTAFTRVFAKSNGKIIAQFEFNVMPIPAPRIFLSDSATGKPINLKDPIHLPSKLYLVAEAEPNFKQIVPQEAHYQIKESTIILYRKGNSISGNFFWSEELDMSSFQIQKGDGIQIIIKNAFRKTSKGDTEPAPVTAPYIGFFVLN